MKISRSWPFFAAACIHGLTARTRLLFRARSLRLVAAPAFALALGLHAEAQSISLTSPSGDAAYSNEIPISYSVTDPAGAPQEVRIVFTCTASEVAPDAVNSPALLTMTTPSAAASFTFNLAAPGPEVGFTPVAPHSTLVNGTYTVVASYVRPASAGGGTITGPALANVTIDTTTRPPVLIRPAAFTTIGSSGGVTLLLPETPLSDSAKLIFTSLGTGSETAITLVAPQTGSAITPGDVPGDAVPAGTYTLTLRYQDALGNPAASTSVHSVTVDPATLPPTLVNLSTGSTITEGSSISFVLPETPSPGSVELVFSNGTTNTVIALGNALSSSFVYNEALHGLAIPRGTYSVALRYRDVHGNPPASATAESVFVDISTQAATFPHFASGSVLYNGAAIAYVLPEAPQPGGVRLVFDNGTSPVVITLGDAQTASFVYSTDAHGTTIPPGAYSVTLTYQDLVGNAPAATTVSGVSVLSSSNDTDDDGLNDVAEAKLAALGLDWQVSQPALTAAFLADTALFTQAQITSSRLAGRADVTSAPESFELYTLAGLQDLYVDTPLLVRDPSTGNWTLTVTVERSTDLNSFAPFPFSADGTTINPAGELEFEFTETNPKVFFRLQAR